MGGSQVPICLMMALFLVSEVPLYLAGGGRGRRAAGHAAADGQNRRMAKTGSGCKAQFRTRRRVTGAGQVSKFLT